jgi:hypothetical protein
MLVVMSTVVPVAPVHYGLTLVLITPAAVLEDTVPARAQAALAAAAQVAPLAPMDLAAVVVPTLEMLQAPAMPEDLVWSSLPTQVLK